MRVATKSIFWQMFAACLAVMLFAVAATSLYAFRLLSLQPQEQAGQGLKAQAAQLALHLADAPDAAGLPALTQRAGETLGLRVTLMDADGAVLAETHREAAAMASHAGRPEVREALEAGVGLAERRSATLHRDLLYAAARFDRGERRYVVRIAVPVQEAQRAVAGAQQRLLAAAAAVAGLGAAFCSMLSRRVARPLRAAAQSARRLGEGDLSHRLAPPRQEEVAHLAEQINRMADTLQQRLGVIHEQAEESGAILSGMIEGVLAVDREMRVLRINDAAGRLLDVKPGACEGLSMPEILRHAELLAYARGVLSGAIRERRDIAINSGKDLILEVSGTFLRDAEGAPVGAVLVLNDVTRVRRMQQVRSEFVANVSHELKTPLTSILGFAETLRDGALERRAEADHFLEIIERQARRMIGIVEDLLQLSRLEEEMARGEIRREEAALRPILDAAVQHTLGRDAHAGRTVRVECAESLTALMNPPLLEQALVNLLDNALKYSEADRPVDVVVTREESRFVRIEVRDQGEGISQQHLPHIFERFYRVDKARSREVGGTGLGLSIAKHVAQAHGGSIHAESKLGRGSIFSLRIPAP